MKNHLIDLGMIAGIVMLGWTVVGQYHEAQSNAEASRVMYVQQTCDQLHTTPSSRSYEACGDAQAATNTEYLCNHANTSCWVESK